MDDVSLGHIEVDAFDATDESDEKVGGKKDFASLEEREFEKSTGEIRSVQFACAAFGKLALARFAFYDVQLGLGFWLWVLPTCEFWKADVVELSDAHETSE